MKFSKMDKKPWGERRSIKNNNKVLGILLALALVVSGMEIFSIEIENNGIGIGGIEKAYASARLTKPSIKTATSIDDCVVMVAWNKVSGASGYEIYRSGSANGTFKKIKKTTAGSYRDKSLKTGKTYYYKVRAISKNSANNSNFSDVLSAKTTSAKIVDITNVKAYSNKPYVNVNGGKPYFTEAQKKLPVFEYYADLDSLGRCGTTIAMVGKSLMPTSARESIGMVKPTGWQTVRYDDLVDGKYLYNRCHLIGFQIAGENANKKNLVTGTRYLNVTGMLPFEDEVADYVKSTGKKLLYRVRPVFVGKELVCRGVEMEGYSVSDGGKSVCFNVFVYNVQPGVVIDYKTGESKRVDGKPNSNSGGSGQSAGSSSSGSSGSSTSGSSSSSTSGSTSGSSSLLSSRPSTSNYFVVNVNTNVYHYPSCSSVSRMSESNKRYYTGSANSLESKGYRGCERCVG